MHIDPKFKISFYLIFLNISAAYYFSLCVYVFPSALDDCVFLFLTGSDPPGLS